VFAATDKKKEYVGAALFWIAVNPIQLIGGFSNLGSLNDSLFYILLLFPLLNDSQARKPSTNCILNAFASYFDPRLLMLLIPITVLQARFQVDDEGRKLRTQAEAFQETLKRLGVTSALLFLIHVCATSQT